MSDITRVEFRLSRNPYTKEDEVLAVFIDEPWNRDGSEVTSYLHCGQHGACSKSYYKRLRFASREQYAALKRELEDGVGYHLQVMNKPEGKVETARIAA